MALKLFNTLGRAKQEFVPIRNGEVGMYTCGPTVYNFLHIGNLRSYTFADILKRTLIYTGYKVKHVMNITDIGHIVSDADLGEDKMVNALMREKKPMTLAAMRELADEYYKMAREDMKQMNILPADEYPFASDNIDKDIEIIALLLEKGVAYSLENAIYFDTKQFPSYGELGGAVAHDTHSRIGANTLKRNPEDFALWKLADNSGLGYEAPFGRGFPGWHIECSAMGIKYLGETFDIHTGGIDLIPIHHNNEITQSECFTGKKFVNYWLHNGFITIGDGEKMAKTGGNFLTLEYLTTEGISPLAYRYWLLTARYSTRMDFSLEAILAAQTAYEKFVSVARDVPSGGLVNQEYKNKFIDAINDDLDTPKALAIAWEMLKDEKISAIDRKATLLDFDFVFGLGLALAKKIVVPAAVQSLLDDRVSAREAKDWTKADELRVAINRLGFDVKDTASGQTLTTLKKGV